MGPLFGALNSTALARIFNHDARSHEEVMTRKAFSAAAVGGFALVVALAAACRAKAQNG